MKKQMIVAILAVLGLIFASAPAAGAKGKPDSAGPPPEYFVDESALPFEAISGATAMWGVHSGAGYRVEVPDDWNGTLVMWAHGFRGTGLELTVDNHPLRPFLIDNGYAWAASSYSRNDYDIKTGVQDTHALATHFNGLVSRPDSVLINGASMGGHITAVSIEQYRNFYDGAMPICGVLGDFELFDFFLDFNIAAQQLGLGSSQFPVDDPGQYLSVDVPAIKANLEAVPGGWPFVLNEDGQRLKDLVELRSGGERPNFDEAWAFWTSSNFLFELGIGDGTIVGSPGVVLDNTDVVYQFDTDPALTAAEQDFNDSVFRVEQDAQGRNRNGLAQVPAIQGDPTVPVMSLHNLGDLFVPFHNEVVYAQRVADNGKSDLLVQRAIRGVGHCDFTGAELATAFSDLVSWIDTGVKPAGDIVLDPNAVADPTYGCNFTIGGHFLGTPC